MDDGDNEPAVLLEHAPGFSKCSVHVVDVHQRHEGDGEVDRAIAERQLGRVGLDEIELGALCACRRDHGGRGVDPDHLMPALGKVASEAALSATDVERQVSRRRNELEKPVAVEAPVAVVIGLACPAHPVRRILIPRILESHR
jgi:hypothetical protein